MAEPAGPVEVILTGHCTLDFVKVSCLLERLVERFLCLGTLEADSECLIVSMRVFRAVEGSEDQALVVLGMCLQIAERHMSKQKVDRLAGTFTLH